MWLRVLYLVSAQRFKPLSFPSDDIQYEHPWICVVSRSSMLWLWAVTVSVTGSCKPSLHRIYMFLMSKGSVSAQSSICTEREVCAFLCHCGLECLPLDSEWAEQQVHGVSSCLPDSCYFDIWDTFWVETSKDLIEGDFHYTTVFLPFHCFPLPCLMSTVPHSLPRASFTWPTLNASHPHTYPLYLNAM